MTYACEKCHDTGSLSKDIEGQTDCVYCTVAGERAGLEIWALRHGLRAGIADLWLIYQHGRNRGLDDAAEVCEKEIDACFSDEATALAANLAALIRAKRGGKN
jgi:hypothetical protein